MFFINRLSRPSSIGILVSSLTFPFMVQAQVSAPDAASEQKASEKKKPVYHFPQWPNRKQVKREMVPPPPPGPYMSTALSGRSFKAPSFSNQTNKPNMTFDSSNVSLDTFSPDVLWPTNIEPPSRWMPENGYRFVQPQAANNSQQAAPGNNQYGYRPQGPQMNWSDNQYRGNNGPANWMPSMGYPANRGQYRPYPGNANDSMSNRSPARQNARQGGLQ